VTATFGIIGFPVAHSQSPAMHEAAFRALGIDAAYLRFEVEPSRLADALRGIVALGIDGVNVTLPHKERAAALVDDATDIARAIGAVNTIVREGERLVGDNTDAEGLVRALEEAGFDPKGREVVVLGAGGAARAAVMGLGHAGAARITVAARRAEGAARLAEELAPAAHAELSGITLFDPSALRAAFASAALLVQATSATLDDGALAAELVAALPLDALPADAWVTDLVYTPLDTAVLRAAHELSLHTVDGLGMLVHQGALAFRAFTGRDAPVDVMRSALG
jgi:shikimate dehydrogenase